MAPERSHPSSSQFAASKTNCFAASAYRRAYQAHHPDTPDIAGIPVASSGDFHCPLDDCHQLSLHGRRHKGMECFTHIINVRISAPQFATGYRITVCWCNSITLVRSERQQKDQHCPSSPDAAVQNSLNWCESSCLRRCLPRHTRPTLPCEDVIREFTALRTFNATLTSRSFRMTAICRCLRCLVLRFDACFCKVISINGAVKIHSSNWSSCFGNSTNHPLRFVWSLFQCCEDCTVVTRHINHVSDLPS